jgi:sirohydrochlorin cobaltochelatase
MVSPFDAAILLAHGARDERWTEPVRRIRDQIESLLPTTAVRLAYMEFAQPTFAAAALDLHDQGKTSVLVVPVFLSGGGHVANDVPPLVRREAERYPRMRFTVAGALGEEPEVLAAMACAVHRLATRGR